MNKSLLDRLFDPSTGNSGVIDLLRTVGILQVVFFHVIHGIVRFAPTEDIPAFIDRLPGLFNFGWQAYGVDVIFVVSAFLLTWSMLREINETGKISYRRFFISRLSRILPVYYLALFLFALAQGNSWWEILTSALFIGYIAGNTNVIPVGWSMEVMILYYIALPFIVTGLQKVGRPILWLAILVTAAALWRFLFLIGLPEDPSQLFLTMIDTKNSSYGGFELYFRPWFRLPAFLMGTLMAYPLAQGLAPRTYWTPAIALSLIIAIIWLPVQDRDSFAYQMASPIVWAIYWALAPVIFARAFGFLMIWALQRGTEKPWNIPWIWSPFSKNIFSVYLFHMPFLAVAAIAVFRTTDAAALGAAHWAEVVVTFVLTSAIALAFAWPVTRYIERPIQNWLLRFSQ